MTIFDFIPRVQFSLANQVHVPGRMNLTKMERLPKSDNISEVCMILNCYPNIKLVLAHSIRYFQQEYLEKALNILEKDIHRLWIDCSAILNAKVCRLVSTHPEYQRVLFGTNLAIFLPQGKYKWNRQGYHNLCREDFSLKEHNKQEEKNHTFFVYAQPNTFLNIIEKVLETVQNIFFNNMKEVYKKSSL